MSKTYKPVPVTDADMAFGGKAMEILPPYASIPQEFKRHSNPWCKWASDWFYSGLKRYPVAADGISRKDAMRSLSCVMGSWGPKHEHKEAGVAYLASLWFSSPEGEEIKRAA